MSRFSIMLNFQNWRKTKALRLTILGILVHVCLFFGTLDVYFSSPVESGLNSFKTDFSLADRVVVFVADGLRYETLHDINFDEYTPFLNNIRRKHGTWGISYTRVPTESRPGHVALFGGMYEDPSAVLSGWKRNPINVDNVFNQSVESWLWGSPDIIPMFNRDNLKKINTYFYDRSFEDFSGRVSTIELDKWVFEHIRDFLRKASVEELEGGGKIFFLHLLGMDTVGHVFKPNSWEYFKNLKYIDKEIRNVYDSFEKFFNDNKTAYMFTSDHGMTDWGSHGSGTDHETQSPFIAWGSGIKGQMQRCDVYQADTAALISALLGINFPTNSVGVVPYLYLDTSLYEEIAILYTNSRQLGERFNKRHERLQRATVYGFFEPFQELNEEILRRKLSYIEISMKTGSYKTAKEDVLSLIRLIRKGDKYIDEYYKYPLLFTLSLGLIFWMIYLLLHVIPESRGALNKKLIFKYFLNYIIVSSALAIALQYHQVQMKYRLYLFFPVLMLIPLIIEVRQVGHLLDLLWRVSKLYLILSVLYCGLGLSLLIFSFYYEFYILIPSILLIVWILSARRDYRKEDVLFWIIVPLLVCFYPLLSAYAKRYSTFQTVASHFIASYVLWIQIRNTANEIKSGKNAARLGHYYILNVYFMLLTISAITAMIYILYGITGQLVQMIVCVLSWFILCGSLFLATTSPHTFIVRCLNISVLFLIIYITMSVSGESLFLVLFATMQIQWIFLEIHKFNRRKQNETNYDDFRRCMFFIYFILLSYFSAGNTANMNTFDPMWARQFVMVFNPFLSAIIILLKITIPFLITTISFQAINAYVNIPTIKVFSIIMLYCDLLVIYFMYSIRNDGSWLQIGLSISRFVIVSVMTVVLLLFYGIAKFLTKNTLFDSLMKYVSIYKNVDRVKVFDM